MTEPAEYSPTKSYNLPTVPNLNPWSFSVYWTEEGNSNGIRPPNPQFQNIPTPSYVLPPTLVPNIADNGKSPVGLIQSKREPYAVEWYWGDYGSLNSKLGTNLGA